MNSNYEIVAQRIVKSGYRQSYTAELAIDECLQNCGIMRSDIDYIVSTGYGRKNLKCSDTNITEISCHAAGINLLNNQVRTVIDIGGQDSKVIKLDENGFVDNFVMNDKCAAGTGRFLENMARVLDMDINEMGKLVQYSRNREDISSTCTIFAESEVISKISSGRNIDDIVAGVHFAIARRIVNMAYGIGINEKIAISGGVAQNMGIIFAIEELLQTKVYLPIQPQIVGALGAAFYAKQLYDKER